MWRLDKVRELFSLIRKQIRDSGHTAGIALYGHGKPLPSHWFRDNNQTAPEPSKRKPQPLRKKEEVKYESDEESQESDAESQEKSSYDQKVSPESESDEENEDSESDGDSDSDSNDEELIGVYDQNHKIYYRESTREFFVKKHSKELNEKHALKMIGQMEEKDSGFREKMREFKKKKGL